MSKSSSHSAVILVGTRDREDVASNRAALASKHLLQVWLASLLLTLVECFDGTLALLCDKVASLLFWKADHLPSSAGLHLKKYSKFKLLPWQLA